MSVDLPEGMKACPFCAEHIKAEAVKCRYCREDLSGAPRAKAELPPIRAPEPRPAEPVRVRVQGQDGPVMRGVRNAVSIMSFVILSAVIGTCVVFGKLATDCTNDARKSNSAHAKPSSSQDPLPQPQPTSQPRVITATDRTIASDSTIDVDLRGPSGIEISVDGKAAGKLPLKVRLQKSSTAIKLSWTAPKSGKPITTEIVPDHDQVVDFTD